MADPGFTTLSRMTDTTSPPPGPGPVRLRPVLSTVPAYTPGRPPEPVEGVAAYKISSNENPYPPLPSVVDAIVRSVQQVNRYPDMGTTALREAIASEIGVDADEIVTGTGSSGVLSAIVNAACEAGEVGVSSHRRFPDPVE